MEWISAILLFSSKSNRKKEKRVVSSTHEQNIICDQTRLDDNVHVQTIICRQLQVKKEEKYQSNDSELLVVSNLSLLTSK